MTEPASLQDDARRKPIRFLRWIIVFAIAAPIIYLASVPFFGRLTERAARTRDLLHGKQIALAIKNNYAIDEDGAYPKDLTELIAYFSQYHPSLAEDRFKPMDWDTMRRHEWIYFPGGSENDPEDRILLASDPIYDGDRIVIFNSGDGEFIGPERYAELIAKMRADGCQIPAEAVR
ncbi:MAG: hypothetical protein R3F11_24315 [Verrucomicrobiales bacterium]